MRLLVTFVGGLGHLAPLLPLARAAHDAGHDVAIAGSGGSAPRWRCWTPGADVLVHHGGSGSLMAALAHGLPSVLLPLGADQPHNARRARELGVAEALDAASATPAAIGRAVGRTLADASMRQRCEVVAAELRVLPGVECAVAALHDAAHQRGTAQPQARRATVRPIR